MRARLFAKLKRNHLLPRPTLSIPPVSILLPVSLTFLRRHCAAIALGAMERSHCRTESNCRTVLEGLFEDEIHGTGPMSVT